MRVERASPSKDLMNSESRRAASHALESAPKRPPPSLPPLPRASDMPHFQFGIFTESNRRGRRFRWHSIFMPQWSWQETRPLLTQRVFHLDCKDILITTGLLSSQPRMLNQTSPNLAPQISTRRTKFRGQYISGESEEGRRADSLYIRPGIKRPQGPR